MMTNGWRGTRGQLRGGMKTRRTSMTCGDHVADDDFILGGGVDDD
jgi:hypothetical protein